MVFFVPELLINNTVAIVMLSAKLPHRGSSPGESVSPL